VLFGTRGLGIEVQRGCVLGVGGMPCGGGEKKKGVLLVCDRKEALLFNIKRGVKRGAPSVVKEGGRKEVGRGGSVFWGDETCFIKKSPAICGGGAEEKGERGFIISRK